MPASQRDLPPSPSPRALWAVPGLELGRWGQIKAFFPSGLFVLSFYKEKEVGLSGERAPSSLVRYCLFLSDKTDTPQFRKGPLSELCPRWEQGREHPFLCARALPSLVPRRLLWLCAGLPGMEPAIDRWMLC